MDVVCLLGLRVFVLFDGEELGLFSRHVDTPRLRKQASASREFIALSRPKSGLLVRIWMYSDAEAKT